MKPYAIESEFSLRNRAKLIKRDKFLRSEPAWFCSLLILFSALLCKVFAPIFLIFSFISFFLIDNVSVLLAVICVLTKLSSQFSRFGKIHFLNLLDLIFSRITYEMGVLLRKIPFLA